MFLHLHHTQALAADSPARLHGSGRSGIAAGRRRFSFWRTLRLEIRSLGYWLVLLAAILLVLYPVVLTLIGSFQTAPPGRPAEYTLDAWRFALSSQSLLMSIWNTVTVTAVRQVIAFPIAILLAWVLARTDVPGGRWLELLFWIAFFVPTLPVALGWIMLLDPTYGLLNQVANAIPGVGKPFNIYSFWGVVWAHLATGTIAIKVMLLTPAFRNMDASLEEASKVHGASTVGTVARIVVPLLTPVLTLVLLLSVIHSLQSFELELILGAPFRFFVFSTQVYSMLRQEPPLFPAATALSTLVLAMTLPLIFLQRWASGRRRFTTVSGQFRSNVWKLGKWRWPVFAVVLGVALLLSVVPLCFLLLGTFMKLFGFFHLPEPWTLAHWDRVLHDSVFTSSLVSTLVLAGGTAIVAVVLFTLVGYIIMRTRFTGRPLLDLTTWLPSTLPGIILGLGLLWLVLGTPFLRGLYGTMFILIAATLIAAMTTSIQIIKGTFAQLGSEIEEAARVSGASWLHCFMHVLLPIMVPTLLLVAALTFVSAARNVSTVALLSTGANRPLSMLQVDFIASGSYEGAAVVGLIIVALTTGVALVTRVLGLRMGIQ